MTLPYLHRPHDSGPIQWARGDVGLKPLRLPRAALRVNYTVVNFFEFFFVCVVFFPDFFNLPFFPDSYFQALWLNPEQAQPGILVKKKEFCANAYSSC